MDTLQDDLERAVPHVDAGPDGLEELLTAGRRAVRRRRARAGGLIAAGGLVVATLAVGATGMLPADDRREARDPAVATAPNAPQSAAPEVEGPHVRLTLSDVLEVRTTCGRRGDAERVDEVRGDGWAAVEFTCGGTTVRVLRISGGGLVERLERGDGSTLEQWGEARVGGGR